MNVVGAVSGIHFEIDPAQLGFVVSVVFKKVRQVELGLFDFLSNHAVSGRERYGVMGQGRVDKAVRRMKLEGTEGMLGPCVNLVIGLRPAAFDFIVARDFGIEITKVEIMYAQLCRTLYP